MVQHVKHFSAELQPWAFVSAVAEKVRQIEILEHGEVPIVESGLADVVSGRVAESAGSLENKGAGIEILRNGLLAAIEVWRGNYVRTLANSTSVGKPSDIVVDTYVVGRPERAT